MGTGGNRGGRHVGPGAGSAAQGTRGTDLGDAYGDGRQLHLPREGKKTGKKGWEPAWEGHGISLYCFISLKNLKTKQVLILAQGGANTFELCI